MSSAIGALRDIGPTLRRTRGNPRARLGLGVAALIVAIAFPLASPGQYPVSVATNILIYLVLVLGLNVMLGYAGILNLGYAAFAGVGGYAAALLMLRLDIPFWLALPLAAALATFLSLILALPTLHLSRVYLGIVTLAFGEIFTLVMLNAKSITGGGFGLAGIPRPELFGTTLFDTTRFYYVPLVTAVVLLVFIVRLTLSRHGRAFEYVREDEVAAESTGIDVARTKLVAYGIGSAYAGIGGVLLADQLTAINPSVFDFTLTLLILTMVVVGGTGSVGGAIVGTLLLALLPEVLRDFRDFRPLVYGVALAVIVLARPQGLLPPRRQRAFEALADAASAYAPQMAKVATAVSSTRLLEARGVSKRYGGLIAVENVDVAVDQGSVLSIIGPNGAGKTTLVDILTGVTAPSSGTVTYGGIEVTGWRPSLRARAGMARTFQRVRLFNDLTVLENVIAGRHVRLRAGPLSSVVRTPAQRAEERASASAAAYWLRFVGMGLFERRDELVRNLPYGVQKQIEIARALASEPNLLLLDEPAAGLNSGEKEMLAALIRQIHDAGITVVLIEHDMRLVMNLSDRVVVLDNGRVIFEGDGAAAQSDPRVIEAYLGLETA